MNNLLDAEVNSCQIFVKTGSASLLPITQSPRRESGIPSLSPDPALVFLFLPHAGCVRLAQATRVMSITNKRHSIWGIGREGKSLAAARRTL